MRRPTSVDALLAEIAYIVAGTYTVAGDAAPSADDEALGRIRDRLDEWKPALMEAGKHKREREKGKRATRR
jgi:hypothetical protein